MASRGKVGEAQQAGLGLASLHHFHGLWGAGVAFRCPVTGSGVRVAQSVRVCKEAGCPVGSGWAGLHVKAMRCLLSLGIGSPGSAGPRCQRLRIKRNAECIGK